MKVVFECSYLTITSFPTIEIPDFTIIHGINGSGKTHFLKAIAQGSLLLEKDGTPLSTTYIDKFSEFDPLDYARPTVEEWQVNLYKQLQSFLASSTEITKFINENTTALQRSSFSREDSRKTLLDIAITRYSQGPENGRQQLNERLHRELRNSPPGLVSAVDDALENSDLCIHELSTENFSNRSEIFSADYRNPALGRLFYSYIDHYHAFVKGKVRRHPEYSVSSFEPEFTARFGAPPWEAYNQELREIGVDFSFHVDPKTAAESPFPRIELRKAGTSLVHEHLSSGERVMLGLALSSIVKDSKTMRVHRPEVLLLDEPDAHLHPAQVKELFLGALQKIVASGTKIIITTHCPTSVALAPENSIFRKLPGEGLCATSKQEAVSSLMVGVPHLALDYSGRRQVFTESTNDAKVYQKIFDLNRERLINERSLSFIGVGSAENGGKARVKSIVNKLRAAGNSSIFGLIDWDLQEANGPHVKVMGQNLYYAIENVILNPLYVGLALIKAKNAAYLNDFRFSDISSLSKEDLQRIVQIITSEIDVPFGTATTKIYLCCGKYVDIPNEFLTMNCKFYEKLISTKFPIVKLANTADKCLKWAITDHVLSEHPELCPAIILDVFNSILTS